MQDIDAVQPWREIVASALDWRQARATFDDAVAGLSVALCAQRVDGYQHSVWELVEHIRRAQDDLVSFMRDESYQAPEWPRDYWPAEPAPESSVAWDRSIAAVHTSCAELKRIALDPGLDLTAAIPWGNGQTYLRTLLVAVDHASYHVGQIVMLRIILGAWPGR